MLADVRGMFPNFLDFQILLKAGRQAQGLNAIEQLRQMNAAREGGEVQQERRPPPLYIVNRRESPPNLDE
jgi:hypothetical protein